MLLLGTTLRAKEGGLLVVALAAADKARATPSGLNRTRGATEVLIDLDNVLSTLFDGVARASRAAGMGSRMARGGILVVVVVAAT